MAYSLKSSGDSVAIFLTMSLYKARLVAVNLPFHYLYTILCKYLCLNLLFLYTKVGVSSINVTALKRASLICGVNL